MSGSMRALRSGLLLLCVLLAGCMSTTDELRGLAERPPLDRAVLVSGGAFFAEGSAARYVPAAR